MAQHVDKRITDVQWRNFGLKSWETKLETPKAPRIETPKTSRGVEMGGGPLPNQLGGLDCEGASWAPPARSGAFLSFPSMFERMLQVLVSHTWTLSDASSFNRPMCSKLNSVYWAFRIWVNYITVCTLHFCITRFEDKIYDFIDS